MASSTTIPSPSKKAKSTIVFKVKTIPDTLAMTGNKTKATNVESGTESPTKMASCTPMKNINTKTTKIKPKITVFNKSFNSTLVRSEPSLVRLTLSPSGNLVSSYFFKIALISSAAEMRFSPPRLITLRVITVFPSKRA